MKRSPKLTKKQRRVAEDAASKERLIKVVDRIRAIQNSERSTSLGTSFERAVAALVAMCEPQPEGSPKITSEEFMDAALVMVEMSQQRKDLTIEEAAESLVGICADSSRAQGVKDGLDPILAQRLRLLFDHLPSSPTILDRSAQFDAAMAQMAKECS